MNYTLEEYCDLLANKCVLEGNILTDYYTKLLENSRFKHNNEKDLLLTITSMCLFAAYSVWSNDKNHKLRSKLLDTTRKLILHKTAEILAYNKPQTQVVAEAQNIELKYFTPFAQFFKSQVENISKKGNPIDNRMIILVSLHWIHDRINLPDNLWDTLNPLFMKEAEGSFDKIQLLAAAMFLDLGKDNKNGFWSRFIG